MAPDIAELTTQLQQLIPNLKPGLESSRENLLQAARQLVRRLETPAERIIRLSWNDVPMIGAVRVLINLKIFKLLTDSTASKSAVELASASGADPKLVSRLLKQVATDEYVEETGPDEYAANDMTRALASPGGESTVKDCFQLCKIVDRFPDFLKDTKYANPVDNTNSAFQYAYETDMHFFTYLTRPGNEEGARAFQNHMQYKTLGLQWFEDENVMKGIFGDGKFSSNDVAVIDIGGAAGHVLLDFKKSHGNLGGRLILQELPSVIETLDTKALASQGIEAMAHDMLTPQPIQHAKVYHLKMVLHDWPEGECKQALANLRPAMKAGYSRILLNEIVIPDLNAHWFATSVDMLMMLVHAAQERREQEWRALIESIPGLKMKKIWDVQGALEKIIEIESVE